MKKPNLYNVNIYSRENIKELINDINPKYMPKTKEKALEKIKELKPDSIINYPSGSGDLFNLLDDDHKEIFLGVDYRTGFYEHAKKIDNKKFLFKPLSKVEKNSKIDMLISKDLIEFSVDPIKEINDILTAFNPNKVVIITQCSSSSRQTLDSEHRIISIANNSRFINNLYSKKAIEKLAKNLGLKVEFIKEKNYQDYAVIFGELPEKKEKKKSKSKIKKSKEIKN